jgi:Na+-translocating ferredoxin:NAD+ oxidoreductase subunit B
LAALLGRPAIPLDPSLEPAPQPAVAFIREDDCIGCFKCVRACPVDAILGAPQMMHTVITAECTGCGLCLPPCPVDCIDLHELPQGAQPVWAPEVARRRADARRDRTQRKLASEREARDARRAAATLRARRAQTVREAIERVRAKRGVGIAGGGHEH